MGRSEWNLFVKKVYDENKHKSGYSLGDAMKEASKLRKSGKMKPEKAQKQKSTKKNRGTKSRKNHTRNKSKRRH